METLNYIGSKKTLFNNILEVCQNNIKDMNHKNFADLFSGTGTIGYNMNKYCKKIIANDLEYYSYVINYAILKCRYNDKIKNIICDMNNLNPIDNGLIYKNFSENENCERMFFTNENAKKCDSIRTYLNKLYNEKYINYEEFIFLLASIIVSIDKVANTSVVYGAYLKKYKKSALNRLLIKPIHTEQNNNIDNEVHNEKMEDLIIGKKYDIVYLDPPYNHRQYSGNYSPLNYIALYDENIELIGKTGLIKNYNKSIFCSRTKIKDGFIKMIKNINCEYLILSYNNEGLLCLEDLKKILLDKGDIILYKINYNKFKAQKKVKEKNVTEYIWFINTSNKNKKYEEIIIDIKKI
jgi:adenine-specific DNA-methyltransferase